MTGIIILAAGSSSRLGRAKQTLEYKDKSLLRHTIDVAVNAAMGPVIVVVGANEKEIHNHLENEDVAVVTNISWKQGMASSIRTGLTTLLQNKEDVDNVILMVCDQPYVDEKLLKTLLDTKTLTSKTIVACSYNDTRGVPVLFDKIFYSELLSLAGEEGGKKVLFNHPDSVATIPFPKGNIDIDTIEDYQGLHS